MSDSDSIIAPDRILEGASARPREPGLDYTGSVDPAEAAALVAAGRAVVIDVRTAEERSFVGRPPDAVPVPWATGLAMTRNPKFVEELKPHAEAGKALLFLCRSGKRSASAAAAATAAGLGPAFNILEGFEGDPDGNKQRGHKNGWRFRGLPWVQD